METIAVKNELEIETVVAEEQNKKVEYEGEETRELEEFNLTDNELLEADEIVGAIMGDIYERLEQDYCEEYGHRLYADSEIERYIGRRLRLLQIESFDHFCYMAQGFRVGPVGNTSPDTSFPYRHL